MPATILIPTVLRSFTGGKSEVAVEASTAGEALHALTELHTGLHKHLFDEKGELRSFVNVYVRDEDIRHQAGVQTPVTSGDTIMIVPSIAGGC